MQEKFQIILPNGSISLTNVFLHGLFIYIGCIQANDIMGCMGCKYSLLLHSNMLTEDRAGLTVILD